MQSKSGREFWKVNTIDGTVTHQWVMQWTKAMALATPDMRLVSEGVTHEIMSVQDIDLAHKQVEIQTKRTV